MTIYFYITVICSFLFTVQTWWGCWWGCGPAIPTGTFCSSRCKPNSCDNQTPNACKSCDTDFILSGTTCSVDMNSGWAQIDTSQDLSGKLIVSSSVNPSTNWSGSCGVYSYYGNLQSTEIVLVSSEIGIPYPYYSIQIIYWVILIDKWDSTTTPSTTFVQANQQKNVSYATARKTTQPVCLSSDNQNFLKVAQSWSYNQTDTKLEFEIKMGNNKLNNGWGVKQFQLLAKLCNPNCNSCWSSSITNCWSCNTNNGMLLSKNTCNQTCLTGFGQTIGGIVCVQCDLRCTSCFETKDNCSACRTTGTWKSFLYNSSCVAACPNGSFGNLSSNTCDQCDPACLTCKNQSYCYSCAPTYGWKGFVCYDVCPVGTFADLSFPIYNASINCTNCNKYCISCQGSSTNCDSCVLSGINQAYLLNSTCYKTCPDGYYKENYNGAGPNKCLSCDQSCAICTNGPTNCQSCNPDYYFYESSCGTTCPQIYKQNSTEQVYFADVLTWSCLECNQYCVGLSMKMYFPNSLNSEIYIDMNFTEALNFSIFQMETFQTIKAQSAFITMDMFDITYVQTGTNSYRIIVAPKGYIFIYNVTFTVTTKSQSVPIDYSSQNRPFKSINYEKSAKLQWFLVKAPSLSQLQQQIIDGLAVINDKISFITTLPYVQQLKKTGILSLIMGGAQITSCSILVNTIPSQNMYQGVRFWAMFVFFDVPKWEQNSNQTKYVVVPPLQQMIQNARLLTVAQKERMLFDSSKVDWRFQRTGHSSFFIFDCYMNVFMIILCWVLVIISQCVIKKKKSLAQHCGKFYSLLHKVHQISIFYISLTTLLEWMYFDASSIQRWVSLGLCLAANLYFLSYQIYIYHDMLRYPRAQIGSKQYDYYLMKYGSLLKNIRYEEFDYKQEWSFRQWFRPYNYHFISYYKKLMMMVSLPLFYETNNYQIYVLLFLQLLQILRFCFTWPFKTRTRNFIRLLLQICLLAFFASVAIQHYFIGQIVTFDPITQAKQLQTYIKLFYNLGWLSFVLVFSFNFGFLAIFIYDFCLGCRKSNRQLMDQARRDYYMKRLKSYQQENQDVPLGIVNKWIKQGNLNKRNFDELPNIKIRIQYFMITKCQKGGFRIQMKKLTDLCMNVQFNFQKENNITASQKINKSFWLKRNMCPQFYQIIHQLFQLYSQKYQFQSMAIKTFVEVEQSEYNPGEKVKMQSERLTQKVELYTYNNEVKVIKQQKKIYGFPVQASLLSYL